MLFNMSWIADPLRRRQALTAASGALILAALAASSLTARPALGASLLVTAALLTGSDIVARAWSALRSRHIGIELLVTIAAVGAIAIGEFWEAAAVTFLFMLGAYLETRTLQKTRRALQDLLEQAPLTAIMLHDGRQVEVAAHEVLVGETVLVKSDAKLPVDGEVVDGRAAVDESAITGEPMPVEKQVGAQVFAGTICQDGLLHVRAAGVGADTTLARIVRRVEQAQEAQAPTQRLIERFARWYTPAIIGLSAVTFLITRDIELALTLLVVANTMRLLRSETRPCPWQRYGVGVGASGEERMTNASRRRRMSSW